MFKNCKKSCKGEECGTSICGKSSLNYLQESSDANKTHPQHGWLNLHIKSGSHIPLTYLRRRRRLQLTTFGDLFQWGPGASCHGSSTYSNWREMQIELAHFQPFHLQILIESSNWSTLRLQMMFA